MTDPAAVSGDLSLGSSGAPPARLTIDLGALAANYQSLVELAAPNEGRPSSRPTRTDSDSARSSAGSRRWAAAASLSTLDQGLRLRRLLHDCRVFVLQGVGTAIAACRDAHLIPELNSLGEARDWVEHCGGAPAALQVDTGMTRSGLDSREVEQLAADPTQFGALKLELLLTHLACADDVLHPLNVEQLARFQAGRRLLPPMPTSIGNSASLMLGAEYRGDVVRPGIALYGGRPFLTGVNPIPRAVVRLEARVLQIRELTADAWVGYGATYRARAPARVATLGAGYADGYPRALGEQALRLPPAAGSRSSAAFRWTSSRSTYPSSRSANSPPATTSI